MQATLLYDSRCILGEGALWHERQQRIYWVDIEAKTLHSYGWQDQQQHSWQFDKRVTNIVQDRTDGLILGFQGGLGRFNTQNGVLEWLTGIEAEKADHRCNDGNCDPAGRLWIGTMHTGVVEGAGALYCVHPDLTVEKKLDNISISNGIVWSHDHRRMYYIDTLRPCVQSFFYDKHTAEIVFEKTAVQIPEGTGLPDGMAIDEEGMLWVCHYGGYGVYRWDPHTGKLLDKIELPAPHVTSCAFGGEDLHTLFITTARENLHADALDKYPLSGGIFTARLPVGGVLPGKFGG